VEEPDEGHCHRALLHDNTLVYQKDEIHSICEPLQQRSLSRAIEQLARDRYREELAKSAWTTRNLANHLANEAKGAGAFLTAAPSEELGLRLSPAEWTVAVGRRIGCQLLDSTIRCPICLHGVMDLWGDHALMCHSGGDRIAGHNRLVNRLADDMRKAMCQPVVEPSQMLKGRLRSDILCRDFALGKDMCFDLQ
jgi:hypothetical protein